MCLNPTDLGELSLSIVVTRPVSGYIDPYYWLKYLNVAQTFMSSNRCNENGTSKNLL